MRRILRVTGATALLAVLAVWVAAPGQAAPSGTGGCVPDVSGLWEGVFNGQVNSGEVTLNITQDHRRFHWVAVANGVIIAQGDGTIAAMGSDDTAQGSIQGEGPPLLKKVSAHGTVQGGCTFPTHAMFDFTAIYVDGTHDAGTVDLPVHIPTGDGGT